MAVGLTVRDEARRAGRAGDLRDGMQVGAERAVSCGEAEGPVLEALLQGRRQRETRWRREEYTLDAQRAVAPPRDLDGLLTQAGLIEGEADDAVARHELVERRLAGGEGAAHHRHDLPRPCDVADQFDDPSHPEVAADADVHAHIAWAAAVGGRVACGLVFARVDQVIGQPRVRFIEPLALVLLAPQEIVGEHRVELLDVGRVAVAHGVVDCHCVTRPRAGGGGCEFVKFPRLAAGRAGDDGTPAACDGRQHGRPDLACISVTRELIEVDIAAVAPRRVGVGGQGRHDIAAAGVPFVRVIDLAVNLDLAVEQDIEGQLMRARVPMDVRAHGLARLALSA